MMTIDAMIDIQRYGPKGLKSVVYDGATSGFNDIMTNLGAILIRCLQMFLFLTILNS